MTTDRKLSGWGPAGAGFDPPQAVRTRPSPASMARNRTRMAREFGIAVPFLVEDSSNDSKVAVRLVDFDDRNSAYKSTDSIIA